MVRSRVSRIGRWSVLGPQSSGAVSHDQQVFRAEDVVWACPVASTYRLQCGDTAGQQLEHSMVSYKINEGVSSGIIEKMMISDVFPERVVTIEVA